MRVAAIEENLKRLTKQEEKYAAELEDALKQFSELRDQAKNVDLAELLEQRAALQSDKTVLYHEPTTISFVWAIFFSFWNDAGCAFMNAAKRYTAAAQHTQSTMGVAQTIP